jgi:riboflavin kinase/FMN adenylyltransferase
MKVLKGIEKLTETLHLPVVCIGNFDGVHLGHRQILNTVIQKAQAISGVSVVYTFMPHPQIALRPQVKTQLLTTYYERLQHLEKSGIDYVIEQPFSREFSITTAEEFFNDILLHRLNAKEVVVGYDFSFGKGRQGHLDSLKKYCDQASVRLTVIPPFRVQGDIASSTRIRQFLSASEIQKANELLGYTFYYHGIVQKGEGRGRKLGFKTANLILEQKLVLPLGVYATWTKVNDQKFISVTNIGVRPTFYNKSEMEANIETHIIGQEIDLYGKNITIEFEQKIREEKKFASKEKLSDQIKKDIIMTTNLLS